MNRGASGASPCSTRRACGWISCSTSIRSPGTGTSTYGRATRPDLRRPPPYVALELPVLIPGRICAHAFARDRHVDQVRPVLARDPVHAAPERPFELFPGGD